MPTVRSKWGAVHLFITLEVLESAERLLDASAAFVDGLCKEARLTLLVGLARNDRDDAARARRLSVGLAGVTLVGNGRPRIDIGAEPEQDQEMQCIAPLTSGQVEGDEVSVEIGLQVDLGGEAAA